MERSKYTTYYDMYQEPLEIVRAAGQYCYDSTDKEYLDLYNNVYHVGYCNRRVADAVYKQMTTVVTNTRYVHPALATYAKELLATFPSALGLNTCFFVNSGSEANDLAMRLARSASGISDIHCIQGAYHGTTESCTRVSPSISTGTINENLHSGAYVISRDGSTFSDLPPGNLIHETIQGVAGQVIFREEFLPELYRHIKSRGGLCIADEIQTGFGRTGYHFWAFQYYGLHPDLVTLGKGIGNGYPLGCVVTSRTIASKLGTYFNTFGGNPVACVAGLTTLRITLELDLQHRARKLGDYLLRTLQELKPSLLVRGRGLFIGIEYGSPQQATAVLETMRERGFLLGIGGAQRNVIRIKPPLIITKKDIDKFLAAFLDIHLVAKL